MVDRSGTYNKIVTILDSDKSVTGMLIRCYTKRKSLAENCSQVFIKTYLKHEAQVSKSENI
jgi:hypothetical protein